MSLNYKLYVISDNGNYGEVDCEDLDIITTISINDIADITIKKDTISKNITIKGTKNNNRIFGNLFNMSRYIDNSNESLYYNYAMSRPVECIITENSELLVKGYLKIISVNKTNGVVSFEAIVTGNIVNFYSLINELLMLSDLDFSEYSHPYYLSSIKNSWDTSIVLNGQTVDFNMGKGYVYPFINYGEMNSPSANDINKFHLTNFRAAIYLRTYLDKVFKLPVLGGFSYEIKGNQEFINEIDSLIIPNDQQSLNQTSTGTVVTLTNSTAIDNGNSRVSTEGGITMLKRVLNFTSVFDPRNLVRENTSPFNNQLNNLFIWERSVKSDMSISFNVTMNNNNSNLVRTSVKLLVRDERKEDELNNDLNSFNMLAESNITTVAGNGNYTGVVNFNVPENEFNKGSQFTLLFYAEGNGVSLLSDSFNFSINNLIVKTPSTEETPISYDIVEGDTIAPQPVNNVKIKDFIKSFTQLFNLYTYSINDNPKHIIFETYSDYYSTTTNSTIVDNCLDWSGKMDTSGYTLSPFTNNNKSYAFTYKADSDYWNTQYTSAYGEIYGSYFETDTYKYAANKEVKKIELVFSGTPVVNYGGTTRTYPEILKLESNNSKTSFKSNMRLLYYNGLKSCNEYTIGSMSVNNTGAYVFDGYLNLSFYPQVSHLKCQNGLNNFTLLNDLNFGITKQYYFPVSSFIQDLPNSYSRFYKNQIQEINNINLNILECDILLNPVDISNLSLKNPVLINGADGNSYYKIIQLEYNNRYEPSTVQLQKIIL